MAVESSGVNITISVTDANSSATVAKVEQNLTQLGSAGARAGTQVAAGMRQAEAATMSFAQRNQAAMDAFMAQRRAEQADPAFQARQQQMVAEGNARIAQNQAIANAAAAAKSAAAKTTEATGRMAGGYGEARIAAGALMGSNRAMAMGLAGMAARAQSLAPLMNAMMPVAVGVAMVGIVVQLGEEVYNLYEKWLDTDGAIEKYNDKATEAASKRFYQTAGIDELTKDLKEASKQVDDLNKKRAASPTPVGVSSYETFGRAGGYRVAVERKTQPAPYYGMGDVNEQNQAQVKLDFDRLKLNEELHRVDLQHIQDANLLNEAKLRGIDKERAAMEGADKIAAANRAYAFDQQKILHDISSRTGDLKPGDPNYVGPVSMPDATTGAAEESEARQHAQAEFEAHQFETQRSNATELRHLHEQALEAGMRGSALYHEQEAAAIADLREKGIASAEAVADVRRRFHNEEMKRLEDEQRQTSEIVRTAALAGMTGIQRTQAEGMNRVADIESDPSLADYPAERAKRVVAAQQETNAQIREDQRNFAQEINSLADASATHQVQGFAKIRADASKQLDDLQKKFDEVYGHMSRTTPQDADIYAQGLAQLHRGQSAIGSQESGQEADLARKNAQETAQIEAEANEKWLSAEKQKTAAIQDEYEERLRKFKQEQTEEGLSQDDYNRRVVAAAQIREAELVQNATEAREKMARQFDSLFKGLDHPAKYLQDLGDKVAGEAAATMVQRVQQHFGKSGSPTGLQGFFGTMMSDFGFGGHHGQGSSDTGHGSGHAAHMPAEKSLSIAQAHITVGSATISGFGGMGASSGTMGSTWGSGSGGASPTSSFQPGKGVPGTAGIHDSHSFSSTDTIGQGGSFGSSSASFGGPYSASGAVAGPTSSRSRFVGGAGSSGFADSAMNFASENSSAIPSKGVSTAVGNASSAVDLYKQGKNYFAGFGKSGNQTFGTALSVPFGSSTDLNATLKSRAANQTVGTGLSDPSGMNLSATLKNNAVTGVANSLSLTSAAQKDFSGGSGASSSNSNGGMLGGGGFKANAVDAGQGALGVYSAVEGNGGLGGALSGAMSGMQLGMALGGPMGAAIGAAGGAIAGAIGLGGREKARVYDLKTVRPRLANDRDAFQQGSMDFLSAYSDMESLQTEAFKAVSAMGPAARAYRNEYITPEIKAAEARLNAEQKAGRSQYTAQPASFDVGTDSVPHDGLAYIHRKERIMPSDQNERITRAIESTSGKMPVASAPMGDLHLHVHAIDAKGVQGFLGKYKHDIRSAVNQSYAENSGGGL